MGTSIHTQQDIGIELAKKLDMDYEIHNEGGISSNKDTLDNRPVILNLLRLMDENVVKNKLEMLSNLFDLEIASKILLGAHYQILLNHQFIE